MYVDEVKDGGAGDDRVAGDAGDNKLNGNAGNDEVLGGSGNDILLGARGDDTLNGGRGSDVLTGGVGVDSYVFETVTSGDVDIITDFSVGQNEGLVFGDGVTVTAASVQRTFATTLNGQDLFNGNALDLVLTLTVSARVTQTLAVLDAYNFSSNGFWEGVTGLD